MDYTFNKTLLVILSLSSLLLSSNAVPSSRVNDFISASVPAASPISTSFPAEAPSSIKPDSNHDDDPSNDYPDAPAIDPYFCDKPANKKICNKVPINTTNLDPEILKTCNGEPYGSNLVPDCIENLSKLFKGPFDIVKAVEIEVKTTGDIVKDIFDVIVKLRNNPKITDKCFIDAFDICRDQYGIMMDSINQTLEILRRQNFVDAYNKMDALLSYRDTCDRSLFDLNINILTSVHPEVERSWISAMPWDKQEYLRQMIYICVNILNNIVNNHKF